MEIFSDELSLDFSRIQKAFLLDVFEGCVCQDFSTMVEGNYLQRYVA